jgi:hypothetical protein
LNICKEVLDSYNDGKYDAKLNEKKGKIHTIGIFDELDVS